MPETNTVTIPLDEYFDLREKAQMNTYLIAEQARMEVRFQDIDRRLYDLERRKGE